ncbi:hypothetical protein DNTS_004650 [Danionella cerebrum]|uniref:Starch-binding domain-containing protein 1 n=1 Tax=Danionella cerebrum TaxID=2873325 RepID=A0A553QYD2_9TELE|nr:hypothetical protein DNTS_004650 [Danionella translucida]
MKKSKPVSLDPWRDVRALLNPVNVTGGSCALLAVCIVALLSACATAFFIYRSFGGQGENNGDDTTKETEDSTARRRKREREDLPTEATDRSPDGKQKKHCGDSSSDPSTNKTPPFPPDVPESALNESALKELEEIAQEILKESGDQTESDVDHSMETDPDEITECDDQLQLEEFELLTVPSTSLDCEEVKGDKSETGDEPSETESAQELIHQSSSNPSDPKAHFVEGKMADSGKKFEDHDCLFPPINNFDCCCEKKLEQKKCFHSAGSTRDTSNLSSAETIPNQSNPFDCQNYLGFQIDNTFIGGCATQLRLSQGKKLNEDGKPSEMKHEDEINIMEAIMDHNEWLNVGAPEVKPWLPANEKPEAESKTGSLKEDEELANKRVATVSPLAQMVSVSFRIHYITHTPRQLVAVTGSVPDLGQWEGFVPLQKAKDGFWVKSVALPVESQVEWKFVLVEDGRISRWEECANRSLFLTSQDEEVLLDERWGSC